MTHCSVALDSVVNEEWYALIDSFTETPEGNTEHVKKRGIPFVTFETNENLEVKEIAFDKSAYSREFRADVSTLFFLRRISTIHLYRH